MSTRVTRWLFVASALVIAMTVLYACRAVIAGAVLGRAFAVSPADNVKYEFATPREQLSGLRGGGSTWMDHHDTYVRFQFAQGATPKRMETYQRSGLDAAPLAFFEARFPRDLNSLRDSANLVVHTKHLTPGGLKKCLVYNTRTGVHFFRVWK